MEPRRRVLLTAGVMLVLIVGFYLFSDWFSKATGYALGEDQKVSFANCLKDYGTALYETTGCAACEKQRTLLGESAYAIISKVMCGEDLCNGGIRRTPAWEIDGKLYYGVKTFKELDGLSASCEIE